MKNDLKHEKCGDGIMSPFIFLMVTLFKASMTGKEMGVTDDG